MSFNKLYPLSGKSFVNEYVDLYEVDKDAPPNTNSDIDIIKREIREYMIPYFEDDDIIYYLNKNNGNIKNTCYELLIIKAEDSTIAVSGLTTQDTSNYFKRLASKYKTFNSGSLSTT